ncbi:MAG: hypothetical protein GC206_10035 [Alphaproteobacteria bacterium]|nr:hypothetical protein [Alphaproteobacteria bacterium]
MRLAAAALAAALVLAPAAGFAQQVTIRTEPRPALVVGGWSSDTYACSLYWSEPGADGQAVRRSDTRRVPAGAATYEIASSGPPTDAALACTPDTAPGVTPTPDGCREWVRPAYSALGAAGAAKQFRDINPGRSMVFRIALTPDEEGAPQMIAVTPQRADDPVHIVEWGDRIADEIAAVAAQSRFTPECAGARIMLPFTLR